MEAAVKHASPLTQCSEQILLRAGAGGWGGVGGPFIWAQSLVQWGPCTLSYRVLGFRMKPGCPSPWNQPPTLPRRLGAPNHPQESMASGGPHGSIPAYDSHPVGTLELSQLGGVYAPSSTSALLGHFQGILALLLGCSFSVQVTLHVCVHVRSCMRIHAHTC